MKVVIFCHSIVSDWNHGNAHFLRGITSELQDRGHRVSILEPFSSWSSENLVRDQGAEAIGAFHRAFPGISPLRYDPGTLDLDEQLDGAQLVLVHEWNEPELVSRIGVHRARTRSYRLYFHDTHHRMATDPAAMARYDLAHYDGVLAFGQVIAELYRSRGIAERAWAWHEAADTRIFGPKPETQKEGDLVWIGNWGDEERSEELREFLIQPCYELDLKSRVFGVRYPEEAARELGAHGLEYRGWLPNFLAPDQFARHRVTVHVPRRPYANALPGIPTIRVFEALASGIPLISAPWSDVEGLFQTGRDYLVARNGREMTSRLRQVLHEPDLARELAENGRRAILARHTCAHRVDELLRIDEEIRK